MRELLERVPTSDYLVALEPEELGAELLFALKSRKGHGANQSQFVLGNVLNELAAVGLTGAEVPQAFAEAWAWLEAQGLLVPAPGQTVSTGWKVLSRRARRFEDVSQVKFFDLARRLPREALDERMRQKVWAAFMRGEFDVAAFQAMKAVEVAVREASGLHDKIGVPLMRAAFHPETGPLTSAMAEGGERVARSELFAGAIGAFKNPHSHKEVELTDPEEAMEIVLLANHLLRIVNVRRRIARVRAAAEAINGGTQAPE